MPTGLLLFTIASMSRIRHSESHLCLEPPEYPRRKTRKIEIGKVPVGGGFPVTIQSMTKTDTRDRDATLAQIRSLENAGCEIVRIAVPDQQALDSLAWLKNRSGIPVVADIHFDHRLALGALEAGIDGLRINPGNIGSDEKVREVVTSARDKAVPIRIGVNAGSLEKKLLAKYGEATPAAMVESAINHIRILEDLNFFDTKISLKASDIWRTLEAYRLLAENVDYPFHAGITEAGGLVPGTVKSSIGLALLLKEGLADTIRISLTAAPEAEVRIAYLILSNLGLRQRGVNIISCPICGRCEVDLMAISSAIERELADVDQYLNVAVMGCMVNGPGEAKEADIGVACGRGMGVIFQKGEILRRVKEDDIVAQFVKEVRRLAGDQS